MKFNPENKRKSFFAWDVCDSKSFSVSPAFAFFPILIIIAVVSLLGTGAYLYKVKVESGEEQGEIENFQFPNSNSQSISNELNSSEQPNDNLSSLQMKGGVEEGNDETEGSDNSSPSVSESLPPTGDSSLSQSFEEESSFDRDFAYLTSSDFKDLDKISYLSDTISNDELEDSKISLVGESGDFVDNLHLGETLKIQGGEGIDTEVLNNEVVVSGEDASTDNKGVAKFDSSKFEVTSGKVDILDIYVRNTGDSIDGDLVLNGNFNANGNVVVRDDTTINGNLTGNKGLSVSGGNINLNVSSNYPTNINTGTSTGNITLGSNLNTISLDSSDWDISSVGKLTGISGIDNDGYYTQTGTDANTFTGVTTFNNNIDLAGNFNFSSSSLWKQNNQPFLTSSPTTGDIYVGYQAGTAQIFANTALGYKSLSNSTGISNVAIGYQTLTNSTSANYNVAIGRESMYYNTSGVGNVAVGQRTLYNSLTAWRNTAIGFGAMETNTAGQYNSAFGAFSLHALTTGSYNVDMGYNNIAPTTGSRNITIGSQLGIMSPTSDGQINIGNIVFGTGATGTGTTISGNIGIGASSPDRRLDVLNASAPQLRLTHTDGTVYTDLQTTSAGNLYINSSGGNVGIGTTSPSQQLEVVNSILGNAIYTKTAYYTQGPAGGGLYGVDQNYMTISGGTDYTSSRIWLSGKSRPDYANQMGVILRTGGSFTISNDISGVGLYQAYTNNLVGIGTTSPNKKLSVETTTTPNALFSHDDNVISTFKSSTVSAYGVIKLQADNGSAIWFSDEGGTSQHGYISTKFTGQMDFATGPDNSNPATVKMTILNGGNVGIGLTNPASALHVEKNLGAGSYLATLKNLGQGSGLYIYNSDYDPTDYFLYAENNNGRKVVIDGSGNIGVGTTSPTDNLDIFGTGSNPDARIRSRTANVSASFGAAENDGRYFSYSNGLEIMTHTNYPIGFGVNVGSGSATPNMVIATSGKVGIGTTDPQGRLSINTYEPSSFPIALQIRNESNLGYGAKIALWGGYLGGYNQASIYTAAQDGLYGGAKMLFQTAADDESHTLTNRMIIDMFGNVGIGTTNPTYKLDVAGDLNVSDSSEIRIGGTQVLSKGAGSYPYNLFVGNGGGNLTRPAEAYQAYFNTGMGIGSLYGTTTGQMNTAVGYNSLYTNNTGVINSAFGYNALALNTSGGYNVAIGASALAANTTGNENVAVGMNTLTANTLGY